MSVPAAGRYRVWVGGAVLGRLEVRVSGRLAGVTVHELAHAGQWLRFDALELPAGPADVELRYTDDFRTGRSVPLPLVGPVALTEEEPPPPLVRVPADRFTELCDGRRYDWIEAVSSPS